MVNLVVPLPPPALYVLRTLGPLSTAQPLSLPAELQRLNLTVAGASELGDDAGKPLRRVLAPGSRPPGTTC